MARPQDTPLEILEGTVEKMNFSNEATGFAVVRVSVKTEPFPVTAVGTLATLRLGEEVRFSGYWKTDPKFGRQFAVEDYVPSVPVDVQAIERYLASGLVKGIGKEMAKRIVKTFGPKTIEVIDQRPERLEKVEGIGPKRREMIQKSWAEQKAVREVMIFLQGVGVSPAYAIRIYRQYGAGAPSVIRADPYRLARDVHGIGFKIADKIARDLGFDLENPKRLDAGTTFTLWEAQSDGHIYLPETELINKASQLLDVPFRLVEEAVERLIEGGWLRAEPLMTGGRAVYHPILRDHEMMAAKRLVALMRGGKRDPEKMSFPAEAIAKTQTLSEGQQDALKRSITSPVSIITGGPGTGKCLGRGTPVMLSSGDVVAVEEVKAGDRLMGPDSQPRVVLGTNRGVGPLFRIVPIKGESWVCNDAHVLTLTGTRRYKGKTRDIALNELLEERAHASRLDLNWKLFRVAVQFQEQPVEVEPYLVGLWIGDGTLGEPAITTGDEVIRRYCEHVAPQYGAELIVRRDTDTVMNIRFRVGARGAANRTTPSILRRFFGDASEGGKHIPAAYLQNSEAVRLELLAGIIDTDGCLSDGGYELITVSDVLARQYLWLSRSLGFAAYDYPSQKSIKSTGFVGMYHRIFISGDVSRIPCKLERRKTPPRKQIKRTLVTGFEATPIGEGEYFGFTLDGDGRFLLGDFTVTHNTTMIKAFLTMLESKGTKTVLAAPTGRAAKRLEQSTGKQAQTIHRLLEFNPKEGKFTRNAANPIEADALILDEASMIDLPLARQLLEAVRPSAQFCLVGDVDQLPSVGPGLFLADSIRSAAMPVSRLNEVFRQAAQSQIVNAAHSILKGKYPISGSEGSDFFIIERNDPQKAIETIKELVTKRIPNKFGFDPKNDIQVLAPMHRGVVGVENINLELQSALNPGGASLGPGSHGLKVGDKVMQVKNDYDKDVFNGDVGFIEGISEDDGLVAVRFDERTVFYPVADLDELHLAYSISIHKCVAGYGLAHVDGRGLVPVSRVKIGEKIQTGQRGARKILDYIPTGEKEIVRLRTRYGYSLDVSKEHPILVADRERGPHFKTAQELQPGDYACIDRSLVEGREVALPEIEYGNERQERLTPPKTLTAELAWVLGVIVGDGSCRDKKDGMIDVTSQDKELLDRYQQFWEGIGLHIGRSKKANHERAFFCSRPLRAWLEKIGLGFWLSDEKRTPSLLFEAPADVRAAYLRGLFDIDGSAGWIGLRFTSASERLTREVQALLLSLGIVSSQYSEGPRHFKVGVAGTSVRLYQDRVGFVVEHKQQKLQKLVARARGKTNRDIIPYGAGLMRAYKGTLPASKGRVGEGLCENRSAHLGFVGRVINGEVRLNYYHIRELENYKYPLTEGLREVLQSNYFYDEIESVERLTEQTEMFDLEVEDKHSFVVGGFVCHNSQGSEYPAVVLPMLTQHFVMLQRNLFYTAVTRGKKLVVVVGDPRAIKMAVKNDKPQERYSRLIERLREESTAL